MKSPIEDIDSIREFIQEKSRVPREHAEVTNVVVVFQTKNEHGTGTGYMHQNMSQETLKEILGDAYDKALSSEE